jgi:hypothetical protein
MRSGGLHLLTMAATGGWARHVDSTDSSPSPLSMSTYVAWRLATSAPSVTTNCQPSLNHAVTRSAPLLGATEEMGMGMDETQMILALRALRELLDNGDRDDGDELVASYRALGKAIVKNKPMTRKDRTRVAKYLREAGWEDPIGTAAA